MKEQLISFETAKLAKEKGFIPSDGITCKSYLQDGRVGYQTIWDLDLKYTCLEDHIIAVTQSLLQKWLREKYSIYAESRYNETFNYFEDYVFYNNNYPKPTCIQKDVHSTYEIGLEFALIEALNLIDSDLVIDNEG